MLEAKCHKAQVNPHAVKGECALLEASPWAKSLDPCQEEAAAEAQENEAIRSERSSAMVGGPAPDNRRASKYWPSTRSSVY